MKEYIEKLMDRLEESKKVLEEAAIKEMCINGHSLDYENYNGAIGAVKCVITLVKHLAKEHNKQNIDQDLMIVESLSSLYPMMQPFEEEAVHRVVERAKYNYGWILCSERLPEVFDNVLICTKEGGRAIGHRCPNQKTGRYYDLHGSAIDSVIAWQPLPEPFKLKD